MYALFNCFLCRSYTSTNVVSATWVDISPYIKLLFDPDTKEMSVEVLKSLSESLDDGNDIISFLVTTTCESAKTVNITFNFVIQDTNDRPALFSSLEYEVVLQTPWPSDIPININIPITVTDKDYDAANAIVTFSSDNENVTVIPSTLDPTSKPFTYDLVLLLKDIESQFTEDTTFELTATNGPFTNKALVKVFVKKTNVLPPKFDKPWYKPGSKIPWPPTNGDEILIPMTLTDPESNPFDISFGGGGDHPDLVEKIEFDGTNLRLAFKTVPSDLSGFENGVAIIELIATDSDNLASTSTLLLFFDTTETSSTTVDGKLNINIWM